MAEAATVLRFPSGHAADVAPEIVNVVVENARLTRLIARDASRTLACQEEREEEEEGGGPGHCPGS